VADKDRDLTKEEFLSKYEDRVKPFYEGGRFGEFDGAGGIKIRYACFENSDETGALVVLPGKSETYLKYAELFHDLQDLQLSLYCMDHRGMGFSQRILADRLKIHVDSFDHYIEDVKTFLETVVKQRQHERIFLLGHSMGGLVAVLYLETYTEDFGAAVLNAPMLEIDFHALPGFVARAVARILDSPGRGEEYGPGQKNLKQPSFQQNQITHSQPRWSLWEESIIPGVREIQFSGVTNHWLWESIETGRRALQRAKAISVPVLMLQAEQDTITRAGSQNRFCSAVPLCRKFVVRGARHEILIEQEDIRREAIAQIKSFLTHQVEKT